MVIGEHLAVRLRTLRDGAALQILALDRGHHGRARGVSSVLSLGVNAYVEDPMRFGELQEKLAGLVAAAARHAQELGGLPALLAQPALASGDLSGIPLPAYVFGLHREQRDGVLVIAHRELTRRVFLRAGAPVSYDSNAPRDSLLAHLGERGRLSEQQAAEVSRSLAQGLRIGAALAEAGVELEGVSLLETLRDYTREKVAEALGMPAGRWAFYQGGGFEQEIATVELPTLAVLLDCVRRAVPLKHLHQVLKQHLGHFPYRTASFAVELPSLGLSTSDLKIAMQANGRVRLRELLAHGRGDLREGATLYWLLALAGAIDFRETPEGEGAETLPPRKRKALPQDITQALREEAVRIITGSYFRVLGLTIAADRAEVERAYREIAPRFHPDSYPEYDLSDVEDLLESVQEKLTASYKVLSNDEKRRAYLQFLLSRLEVPRSAGVQADAEIALKRGEAALRRGEVTVARIAFERAVELNPREPEYYSFLAWATWLTEGQAPAQRAQAALRTLKKGLSLNPHLERAQVIHAIIEGEQGEHAHARRRLLKVLELNPSSVIAKAALRRVGR
jgi:hypothetical protein